MKIALFLACALLLFAHTTAAQPPPPGVKLGLAANFQREYAAIKRDLMEAAEKMPEEAYNFKPTTMAEVRTYGQLFGHTANVQYTNCSAAKEVPNPNLGNDNEKRTTKAEFLEALADSFAFCDGAYAALTDANSHDFVKLGQGEIARAAALANNLAHNNEMYGTAAVYLRTRTIVPPSTDNAARGVGRGGRSRTAGARPGVAQP
jgi:hypothetical protein